MITKNEELSTYHEISRAQIHGYDINCVTLVRLRDQVIDLIACGADEKIIRVVEPPANVANLLNYSTRSNLHLFFESPSEEENYVVKNKKDVLEYVAYTEGGVQVLGLMTKVQTVGREKITNYYEK